MEEQTERLERQNNQRILDDEKEQLSSRLAERVKKLEQQRTESRQRIEEKAAHVPKAPAKLYFGNQEYIKLEDVNLITEEVVIEPEA